MKKRLLGKDEMSIMPFATVKLTTMNHISEIQFLSNRNNEQRIQKLNADQYLNLSTGEVHEFKHTENRSEGLDSLRKTFGALRSLINTNFTGASNELFITLTYRGELQTDDPKRVYDDFRKFMQRLKYKYRDTSTIDYINVLEPHKSGNFHMHVLMKFNELSSVYIKNEDLSNVWRNGYVSVQSISKVDNVGAYVSAYLTDIEAPPGAQGEMVEEKTTFDGEKKKILKGGRLHFYPTGTRIYRSSKGIKKPEIEEMTYRQARKKIGADTPISVYGVQLRDDEKHFNNTIIKEQYNTKRKKDSRR